MFKKCLFTTSSLLPVVFLFTLPPVLAQANVTPTQAALGNPGQIRQVFDEYMAKYNHFLSHQELKQSPQLYSRDLMLMSGRNAPSVVKNHLFSKQISAFLTGLKQQGVARVEWEKVDIQLLSDKVALAANVAIRYTQSGKVHNRVGATYFLNKGPEGWKISAFAVHSAKNSPDL